MEEPSLEALMQASLIFVVAVAIILSNLLIIATYLNFRGKSEMFFVFAIHFLCIDPDVNPDVFSRGIRIKEIVTNYNY